MIRDVLKAAWADSPRRVILATCAIPLVIGWTYLVTVAYLVGFGA